jgi:hypothetical protein
MVENCTKFVIMTFWGEMCNPIRFDTAARPARFISGLVNSLLPWQSSFVCFFAVSLLF